LTVVGVALTVVGAALTVVRAIVTVVAQEGTRLLPLEPAVLVREDRER
jgi:hypothetical protein